MVVLWVGGGGGGVVGVVVGGGLVEACGLSSSQKQQPYTVSSPLKHLA